MKLLIRNLARTTTEVELQASGFVEMPKRSNAKVALNILNGKDVADSKIRVKKAE